MIKISFFIQSLLLAATLERLVAAQGDAGYKVGTWLVFSAFSLFGCCKGPLS